MTHRRFTLSAFVATLAVLLASAGAGQASSIGGRIAFEDFNTGEIYSINPNGSGLQQLTHTDQSHTASWPDFSADGSHILFSYLLANAGGNDNARIWIMNADGSHAHQLASDAPGYRDYEPRYTPDQRYIIFSRCQPSDGLCEIAEMRANGTGMHAITHFATGNTDANYFNPTVSPNGRLIAFTRFSFRGIVAQLWIMRADGSDKHAITPPALEANNPRWSPNGKWIIFNTNSDRPGSTIWITNPAGTTRHALTNPGFPHNDIQPSYSPSGTHITFASDRPFSDLCCVDLFIANPDGSNIHRITTGLTGVLNPVWGDTL
jgi:Tol biopolymer transport system component